MLLGRYVTNKQTLSVHVLVGVYVLGKTCTDTGGTSSMITCHTDSEKQRAAADDRGRQEERDVARGGQCDPVYACLLLVCSCLSGSVRAWLTCGYTGVTSSVVSCHAD